jgi:homoserine kinase
MQDRLHQPYRMAACPLLARLLPLADLPHPAGIQSFQGIRSVQIVPGVLGVALSGAGPSVLVIAEAGASAGEIVSEIRRAALNPQLEVIETTIASGAIQELVSG